MKNEIYETEENLKTKKKDDLKKGTDETEENLKTKKKNDLRTGTDETEDNLKTKKQDNLNNGTEQNSKTETDPEEIDLLGSGDETKNISGVSVMKSSNKVASAAACTPLGIAA